MLILLMALIHLHAILFSERSAKFRSFEKMVGIGSQLNMDYKCWFWFSNGKNSKTGACFLMYFSLSNI